MKTIHYAKSIVLVIYYGFKTIRLMKWTGLGVLMLSLQIITNALYLHSKPLSMVGLGILFFGAWMLLKFK